MKYPLVKEKTTIREDSSFFLVHNINLKKDLITNKDLGNLLKKCDGSKEIRQICKELSDDLKKNYAEIYRKTNSILESLEKEGFVRFSDHPEKIDVRIRKQPYIFPLNMVYLEPTRKCNLKCKHCYASSPSYKPTNEMSEKEIFEIIDRLDALGVMSISITGGEPFYREEIFDYLDYIHHKNIEFGILSNGTLLNNEKINHLKKLNPKFIAISLDSNIREIHEKIRGKGTYDKTLENILKLLDRKINVQLNGILFNGLNNSYEQIRDYLTFAKKIGIPGHNIALDEFVAEGEGKDKHYFENEPKSLMKRIKRAFKEVYNIDFKVLKDTGDIDRDSYCGIGRTTCYIRSDGNVVLCPVLSSDEFIQGNIRKKDILDIWKEGKDFQQFRENKHFLTGICGECDVNQECMGGCKAKAYVRNGDLLSNDIWMCSYFNKI